MIFFQKFFISCLMLQSLKEPFHQFPNWLMLPQFLKKFQRTLNIITDQSAFSKIFQKCLKNLCMATFMNKYFFIFQCGFRKSYSTQQRLLALIEKWKTAVDIGESFGALLTDL